jgi:hypothetical protein
MTDREKVLAWLKHIGETDQAIIDEIIFACKNDPEARAYYVKRSAEVNQFSDKIQHIKDLAIIQKMKKHKSVDRKTLAGGT